jgi:hypothetical protein
MITEAGMQMVGSLEFAQYFAEQLAEMEGAGMLERDRIAAAIGVVAQAMRGKGMANPTSADEQTAQLMFCAEHYKEIVVAIEKITGLLDSLYGSSPS